MALRRRTTWMHGMAVFCLASVVFLVSRDLLIDRVRDVEVWFGVELRGQLALMTAPIHWVIFLVGAWGFWFQRPWVIPCSVGYAFYIAFCHLIWNGISPNGWGWFAGVVQASLFSVPGFLLLRARQSRQNGACDNG